MSEMGLVIQDLVINSASAKVLDGVCLEVRPGERVGLVGPSGAGKSTLSLAMLGYIAPGLRLAGGDLSVGTEPIITSGRLSSPANIRKIRRRIGRLDQDPAASLTPTHRIGRLMAELSAASSRLAAVERDEALRVFGLPTTKNFLARFPAELSGGQRRRVALARTLLRRPGLLILDEPTAGLDPQAVDAVLGLVEALVDELAATLIVITHDPGWRNDCPIGSSPFLPAGRFPNCGLPVLCRLGTVPSRMLVRLTGHGLGDGQMGQMGLLAKPVVFSLVCKTWWLVPLVWPYHRFRD